MRHSEARENSCEGRPAVNFCHGQPVAVFSIHFILYWIPCLYLLLLYLALMISNERGKMGHRILLIHRTHSGPCHLIDRWTLSLFFPPHSLPFPTKLSIYCHFHYSQQNGEFLRSALGIWRLMNRVGCNDCRRICRCYRKVLRDMFRVTIER